MGDEDVSEVMRSSMEAYRASQAPASDQTVPISSGRWATGGSALGQLPADAPVPTSRGEAPSSRRGLVVVVALLMLTALGAATLVLYAGM